LDDCDPIFQLVIIAAQLMLFLTNYVYERLTIPVLPRLKVIIRIA